MFSLKTTNAQHFDTLGHKVTYYPQSLMVATNPRTVTFYTDSILLSVQTDLYPIGLGRTLKMQNNCSMEYQAFFDKLLDTLHDVQRMSKRLLSLNSVINLLECDHFLAKLYLYDTGKTSRMMCPRGYADSIHECKKWALRNCDGITPSEKLWLYILLLIDNADHRGYAMQDFSRFQGSCINFQVIVVKPQYYKHQENTQTNGSLVWNTPTNG